MPSDAHFVRLPVPLALLLGLFLPNLPPLALHYPLASANTNVKCKLRPTLLLRACGERPASVTASTGRGGPHHCMWTSSSVIHHSPRWLPVSFVLCPIMYISNDNLHRRECSALQTSKPTYLALQFFSLFFFLPHAKSCRIIQPISRLHNHLFYCGIPKFLKCDPHDNVLN